MRNDKSVQWLLPGVSPAFQDLISLQDYSSAERAHYTESIHHAIATPYNAEALMPRKERDYAAYIAKKKEGKRNR